MFVRVKIPFLGNRNYIAFTRENRAGVIILLEENPEKMPSDFASELASTIDSTPEIIFLKPCQLKRNSNNQEIDFDSSINAYQNNEYANSKTSPAFISSISQTVKKEEFPVSHNQARLLLLSNESDKASTCYNMPIGIHLKGELNLTLLESSLKHMIKQHASLRTSFTIKDGKFYQVINPLEIAEGYSIESIVLSKNNSTEEHAKSLMVKLAIFYCKASA